jgi:hypothetical protein
MKLALLAGFAVLAGLVAGVGGAGAAPVSFVVKTTADTGPHSLRAEILAANAATGQAQILFAIPGSGVQTIKVTSAPLPPIARQLLVDGRSQPGFAGTPLIRIDNATGDASAIGLEVDAGPSRILSLDVTSFVDGVLFKGGGGSTLAGSWLGLNPSGNASANQTGVLVQDSSGNLIGGQSAAARNVISGNKLSGVEIAGGSDTTGNTVSGNYIGTNLTGDGARPNGTGVLVSGGSSNTIGGVTAGAANVISGNVTDGVAITDAATLTRVEGSLIGLNAAGTAPVKNGRDGVRLTNGGGNQIGRSQAHNVISGNGANGITLTATAGNRVVGNLVGTDPAGANAIPNGADGIGLSDSDSNTIGGATASVRNLVSGNALDGISVAGGTRDQIVGNYVGTDATGTTAIPNGGNGLTLSGGASDNSIGWQVIGGLQPQSGYAPNGNVLSGNLGSGIVISGLAPAHGDTSGNAVMGNFIGTDAAGAGALPNHADGVLIDSAASNVIGGRPNNGGTPQLGRNLISGNGQAGVRIRGALSTGNKVHDDLIGTDLNGGTAVHNGLGVVIESGANGNQVGSNRTTFPTVISGNAASGVTIRGAGTDANVITGVLIGTNAAGSAALPNAQHGVEITLGASGTVIGGTTADTQNVISGNTGLGIRAENGSSGTVIQGNDIGTDATGTAPLGNPAGGILFLGSSGNVVGGGSDKPVNTIKFNGAAGVKVDGSTGAANGNRILGNAIDQNGALGIALVGGGNNRQAPPSILAVHSDGTKTTVKATLTSAASASFRIELFASPACDPSGAGEGARFDAAKIVATDSGGHATFSVVGAEIPSGQAVTLTATRQDTGDTSAFSLCAAAP